MKEAHSASTLQMERRKHQWTDTLVTNRRNGSIVGNTAGLRATLMSIEETPQCQNWQSARKAENQILQPHHSKRAVWLNPTLAGVLG